VDVLIFDIDDTLYPVSSGFSDHRNGEVVCRFMVERLGFQTSQEAKTLRDEFFKKYHSTLKGLTIADGEGRLPRPFKKEELGEFWAEHCDFPKYVKPNPELADALRSLRADAGLELVAFTNSPRRYALRCLDSLGVREHFPDSHVFAVEDVLPACKPEPEAFQTVLAAMGCHDPQRAVMFEDSMKNIRACKALGLRTVLVCEALGSTPGGEAALLGDVADAGDSAVDCALGDIVELRSRLPGLWQKRFAPPTSAGGGGALGGQPPADTLM